jgi:hypothetical protein
MKKISLQNTFGFALQSVLQHFSFFALTMALGVVALALFFAVVGIFEYSELHAELVSKFGGLIHGVQAIMHNGIGVFQYAQYHVHHYLETHLPVALAKYFVTSQAVTLDISTQLTESQYMNFVTVYLAPGLVLKAVLDLISIAWTRVALLTYDKKSIIYEDTLLEWALLPNYLLANFIVYLALVVTMVVCGAVAMVLSPVLGAYAIVADILLALVVVFVYQRLRLARMFVIDKNASGVTAVVQSWDATEGHVLELVEYSAVALILQALAYSTVILVFVIHPLHHQADAAVYRQLCK